MQQYEDSSTDKADEADKVEILDAGFQCLLVVNAKIPLNRYKDEEYCQCLND